MFCSHRWGRKEKDKGRWAVEFREALSTPWKLENQLVRVLLVPLNRLLFAFNGIPWGKHWRVFGVPILQKHRGSKISIGDGLDLRSSKTSNPLGLNHPVVLCTWFRSSELIIGENFGMTGGAICAAEHIQIGNDVAVGANSTIIDTDFHPLDAEERRRNLPAKTAPVCIEDDVFIGMNCMILKGVRIGRGSVIGAGSVVTRDVPPYSIACGNPARVIKKFR